MPCARPFMIHQRPRHHVRPRQQVQRERAGQREPRGLVARRRSGRTPTRLRRETCRSRRRGRSTTRRSAKLADCFLADLLVQLTDTPSFATCPRPPASTLRLKDPEIHHLGIRDHRRVGRRLQAEARSGRSATLQPDIVIAGLQDCRVAGLKYNCAMMQFRSCNSAFLRFCNAVLLVGSVADIRRRRCAKSHQPPFRQMEAQVRRPGAGEQHHDLRAARRARDEGHDRRGERARRQVAVVVHHRVRRQGHAGHRQRGHDDTRSVRISTIGSTRSSTRRTARSRRC